MSGACECVFVIDSFVFFKSVHVYSWKINILYSRETSRRFLYIQLVRLISGWIWLGQHKHTGCCWLLFYYLAQRFSISIVVYLLLVCVFPVKIVNGIKWTSISFIRFYSNEIPIEIQTKHNGISDSCIIIKFGALHLVHFNDIITSKCQNYGIELSCNL